MDSAGLMYLPDPGVWLDKGGQRFIRSEFDPDFPVLVDVTSENWKCSYQGSSHELRWKEIRLPVQIKKAAMDVIARRLRTYAPSYMSSSRYDLDRFGDALVAEGLDKVESFAELSLAQWRAIWNRLPCHAKSFVRGFYLECAARGISGADQETSAELKYWKARHEISHLRDVLQWCPKFGALTTSEHEVLRAACREQAQDESIQDKIARLFTWACHETLKRSEQLLSVRADGVRLIRANGEEIAEYFLHIPPAKAQKGQEYRLEPVTLDLGNALIELATIHEVRDLQTKHDRLFVLPSSNVSVGAWQQHGQVPSSMMGSAVKAWSARRCLVSPRTNGPLIPTPRRLRHTGATAMALQGVPRDQIQEILEHDSPLSSDAYIRAVGSELYPALERASERGLGIIFENLSNAFFFKGAITTSTTGKTIVSPALSADNGPAVVGRCTSGGACNKHPFWACYNGCPHFLAWRHADHAKALEYVERELARWGLAEGGRERSKLTKDFERMAAAIREVISEIERLAVR